MTTIKKIICWLIELIKSLFKKNKKQKSAIKKETLSTKGKKNKISLNAIVNETMPGYMLISNSEQDKLIYSISLMKNALLEEVQREKELEEQKLIKEISNKYNIKVNRILDKKDLEIVISELSDDNKKAVINKFDNIIQRENDFKVHIKEIDKVIDEISKRKISVISENEIENEVSNIINDKNKEIDVDKKITAFNQNVEWIINNIDEDFLNTVIKEYNVVNYVTISTKIIDKNYSRYKQLEEDFKNHRYNKFYYEREINKIKHELKQIQDLKNKKEVSEHIEKLKKELYKKNKDKYDLLYNNELFMKFNKECDNLLDRINVKVIDIKKKEESKEEKKDNKEDENEKKKRRLESIILRFQDMELARKLIMLSQEEDNELINDNQIDFLNHIFEKNQIGLEENFNYLRNKRKAELVIFFNELNMVISKEKKEPFISIDHINFRLNDLEEAVEVKKSEVKKMFNYEEINELKKEDKVKSLVYNEKNNKK